MAQKAPNIVTEEKWTGKAKGGDRDFFRSILSVFKETLEIKSESVHWFDVILDIRQQEQLV